MKKTSRNKLKKIFFISGSVCLGIFLLCSAIVLYIYFNENTVKNFAEKWISKKVDATIEIGSLDYGLFPFNIQAKNILFHMEDSSSSIDLSINDMIGRGDTISLLMKEGRLLDTIEIYGLNLDVRFKDSKDIKPTAVALNELPGQITSLINRLNRISLKDMSIRLEFYTGEKLNLSGAELIILSRTSGEGLDFSFWSNEYSTRTSSPEIEAKGKLSLTGHLNLLYSPMFETNLTIENQAFFSSKIDFPLPERFIFNSSAVSDLENRVNLHDLSLRIPQICELKGGMDMDLSDQPFLSFHPHIKLPELKNILVSLRPYLPTLFSSLDLSGTAEVDLEGWLRLKEADLEYSMAGEMFLDPSHIEMTYKGLSSSGLLSGDISFKASPSQKEFRGDLTWSQGYISGDSWECRGLDLNLPLSVSREQIQISELAGTIKEFSFNVKNRILEQKEIKINGSVYGNLKNSIFQAETLHMTLLPFGEFNVQARFSPGLKNNSFFHLTSPRIQVSEAVDRFKTFIPDEFLVWKPDGKLSFELDVIGKGRHDLELKTKIDLKELSFHDPSFSIAGESMAVGLTVQTGLTPDENQMPLSLDVSLSQGETLLKDQYIKWEDHFFRANLHGRVDALEKILDIDSFNLQTDLLGEIVGRGKIAAGIPLSADLSLSATRIDPVRLLGFLGRELNEDLRDIQIEGEADVLIDVRKRGPRLSFKGKTVFHNGFFEDPANKLLLSGLEIDFPFFLEMGAAPVPAENNFWFDRGSLKIGHIQVNDFKLDDIQLDLLAVRNLFLFKPVQIQLYGGTASIYNSLLRFDRNQNSLNGVTAFLLQEGKIERIISEKPEFPLTGMFHVDMPRMTINGRKISTKGDIRVEIFQGTANVTDIMLDRPFSKNRTIFCDIEFRNFNLEKVTDSLPFGKVTGFVEGGVKDLAVSYGQPEQFSLHIQSVKKKGVPQRFSMKAVDDISILSSGEKTSMGSAALLSYFVSSFRYKEIGILCSLKNDNFTLKGTIREKGKELLVKKDWIFGISVVNAQPDNQISFQDMLSRLKRIGKSS